MPRKAELVDARVSIFHPLQVGDYGFIATVSGVMIGKGTHELESSFPYSNVPTIFLQLSPSLRGLEAKMENIAISPSRLQLRLYQTLLFNFFNTVDVLGNSAS